MLQDASKSSTEPEAEELELASNYSWVGYVNLKKFIEARRPRARSNEPLPPYWLS